MKESPEYEYGYKQGRMQGDDGIWNLGYPPDFWDHLGTDAPGNPSDWDERQDADAVRGFNDGLRDAFAVASRGFLAALDKEA
jgi:hypothetical protein